jgi:hypothetical protein
MPDDDPNQWPLKEAWQANLRRAMSLSDFKDRRPHKLMAWSMCGIVV